MTILLFLYIFLFTACGDTINIVNETNVYIGEDKDNETNTSSETSSSNATRNSNNINQEDNNTDSRTIKSLNGIELYEANLKQVDGNRRYDIEKFDGITSSLTALYFDFNIHDFSPRNQEQEIFVNGQRNSLANIEYNLNTSGQLIASINQQEIYSLELLLSERIKASRVEAYRSDIEIEGVAYTIQIHYLSNFYIVEKLLSSNVFSSIGSFTKNYQSKAFIGDYFRGLVFAEDNKLKEKKSGKYSDAGTYEVKTLDNINLLMIYPDNSNYYYADNSCYILSFSRVWQSKCYLKETKKEKIYYDKDVYDDLLTYLQEKFININISI